MTTHIIARLRGERLWRDDDGWHAVDRQTEEFARHALDLWEMPGYVPDMAAAELLWLQAVFGDLLYVEYREFVSDTHVPDIIP